MVRTSKPDRSGTPTSRSHTQADQGTMRCATCECLKSVTIQVSALQVSASTHPPDRCANCKENANELLYDEAETAVSWASRGERDGHSDHRPVHERLQSRELGARPLLVQRQLRVPPQVHGGGEDVVGVLQPSAALEELLVSEGRGLLALALVSSCCQGRERESAYGAIACSVFVPRGVSGTRERRRRNVQICVGQLLVNLVV